MENAQDKVVMLEDFAVSYTAKGILTEFRCNVLHVPSQKYREGCGLSYKSNRKQIEEITLELNAEGWIVSEYLEGWLGWPRK